MTKLTTERLEQFIANPLGNSLYRTEQMDMARQLLAYEQAAKNPVAWVATDSEGFPEYNGHNEFSSSCGAGTPLYAAPVLSKQPEHSRQHFESLCNQFWNWAELDEIDQDEEPRLEWNGSNYTHRVTAALWKMYQAAPAQPVIPEGLIKAINRLLDNDGSRGCFDALEQHRAKTELERLLAAAQQNEPQNIPENIPAQPVSEPYKLKDAVEDIRNSGVEIDADKINAERDTLNSPVIPDGWKLVPIEPTAEMAQAARDCHEGESFLPYSIYRAMLAAAPAQESE